MNILIVSNYFCPSTTIAAYRIEAFAKYLKEAGHDITVVTEWDEENHIKWHGCDVHYVKNRIAQKAYLEKCRNLHKKWTLKRMANAILSRALLDPSILSWNHWAYKKIVELFKHKHFDVVLSSYPFLASHLLALKLRKNGYKFYWIADMRDEMSKFYFGPPFYRRRIRSYEHEILDSADVTVSVSAHLIKDFKATCDNGRFLEVKNGYDYDEIHDVTFQPQFTMSYIGNLYKNLITPYNLFKAFNELMEERKIPSDSKIKIVGNTYIKLNVPDSIKDNVIQIDRVSHSEAIRMSTETDVLVVIHQTGRKGVYTGKVFDYLATNKPILALCDPNDVIAELLDETKTGFTVDNDDIEGIKRNILKCYSIWKNKEVLPRDWEKIKQYKRKNQINILADYLAAHKDEVESKKA